MQATGWASRVGQATGVSAPEGTGRGDAVPAPPSPVAGELFSWESLILP